MSLALWNMGFNPLPQSRLLTAVLEKPFENIMEKGDSAAGNQHFLLFPQCCLPYHRKGENAGYHDSLPFPQCLLPYQRQKSSFNPLPDDKFFFAGPN